MLTSGAATATSTTDQLKTAKKRSTIDQDSDTDDSSNNNNNNTRSHGANDAAHMQMAGGRRFSTASSDNDGEEQDEEEEECLSAEEENYVCDVSQMRIADSSSGDASSTDYSDSLASDGAECAADVAPPASSVSDERYLNELAAINPRDEERTITELVRASASGQLIESAGQGKSLRVAFGIIVRLVLPLAHGVVRGIRGIRDARFLRVLRSVAASRQAFTNLIAFAANTISMNLSSVQVSHRIEPILKILKIRKSRDGLESLPDSSAGATTPTAAPMYSPFIREPSGSLPLEATQAPTCYCTLNVLAEPPPGTPIRADIIFIHGLHGSLVNTWKQGRWENERRPVEFERPPKPPVRPPKRPRHSRAHLLHPQHKQKRARFAHGEQHRRAHTMTQHHDDEGEEVGAAPGHDANHSDYSFVCGEPQDIHVCEGVEYSFPTFRLRMNDNGRQLQAELESYIRNDDDDAKTKDGGHNGAAKSNKSRAKKNAKNAAANDADDDDENFSKCWPGDWLPLDCPNVRVIACNYTTDQYLWRPLWKKKEARTNLVQRSREMAELLIQARVGYGHPIVWVGHSKGGLFVKQLIVDAWESGRPAMAPFWRSARGVFFYSVPHRGSHLASIKAPLLSRSVELIDIEKNSKYLLDLHRRFASLYHLGHLKIEVFSFVETALTLMSVLYLRIVGVDSADPGIGDVCGIRLDHREICKPRSRECILYKELVKMINKVC